MRAAADHGITVFDTALEYGWGLSERAIADGIDTQDEQFFVITKIPPKNDIWSPPPNSNWRDYFPRDWVISCLEESLANLRTDRVALALLHTWSVEWTEDALEALTALKNRGSAAMIGVSTPDFASNAAIPVASAIDAVELTLNVAEQSPLQWLPQYASHKVQIFARCPFNSGALASLWKPGKQFGSDDWRSRWVDDQWIASQVSISQAFVQLCAKYSLEPSLAALGFVLAIPQVTCVVAGAQSPAQASANASATRSGVPHAFIEEAKSLWKSGVFRAVYNGGG